MNEMMKTVLSLSLSGTLCIFILLFCRPLYRERLSRRWQYYIWLVVIARLLLPWTPDTSPAGSIVQRITQQTSWADTPQGITLETDKTAAQGIMQETDRTDMQKTTQETGKADMQNTEQDAELTSSKNTELAKLQPIRFLMQKLHLIWLVTALLLFIRKAAIYQSFAKFIHAGSAAVNEISLLEHVGEIIREQHIKGTVDLYTNSLISSPLLIGFIHPRIVIPPSAAVLSNTDFHYTVLHELTHYKRMDLLYKWLVQAAVCLHWFNPFVYLMEREISRACELSCDEAVIRNLDAAAKREYGDTLLNAVQKGGSYKNPAASVSLSESKKLLKGRLDAIMKYKKKTKPAKAAAFALSFLLSAGALSAGAYKTPASANASQDETPAPVNSDTYKASSVNSAGSSAASHDGDGVRIIYEDGIYYILTKDVPESGKPVSNITDGSVGIVFVQKDGGYSSFAPFSSDMSRIAENTADICRYVQKQGYLTQEESDIIQSAAREIQDAYEPGTAKLIKLNKESITLTKGSTAVLKLTGTKKKVSWSSGSKKIAAVNKNGKVTAKKAGTTQIFAVIGRIRYACKVKVINPAAKKTDAAADLSSHGITKKDGAYYYQGRRIRIFMDLRPDDSFVTFHYDKKGTIDLRIRRAENNSIIKTEYLSKEEADEIRKDMDIADVSGSDKSDAGLSAEIVRLSKDEVSGTIAKAMKKCKPKKWYVIKRDGVQYIFYDGLPHNYAFQPKISADGIKIKIFDIGSSAENYVLLAVKKDLPLTIYYNNVQAALLEL